MDFFIRKHRSASSVSTTVLLTPARKGTELVLALAGMRMVLAMKAQMTVLLESVLITQMQQQWLPVLTTNVAKLNPV
jgi:hypothetical protein